LCFQINLNLTEPDGKIHKNQQKLKLLSETARPKMERALSWRRSAFLKRHDFNERVVLSVVSEGIDHWGKKKAFAPEHWVHAA
jgi:hypothetical protein